MANHLQNNPFSGLFGSLNDAQSFSSTSCTEEASHPTDNVTFSSQQSSIKEKLNEIVKVSEEDKKINSIVEEIFGFTLKSDNVTKPLVFLQEVANQVAPKTTMDMDLLEQALFERLLLEDPVNHVPQSALDVVKNWTEDEHHAVQTETLTYLYSCHKRLMDLKVSKPKLEDIAMKMDGLVVRNIVTALTQPEVYARENLHQEFQAMFRDCETSYFIPLLSRVTNILLSEEGKDALFSAFKPFLDSIHHRVSQSNVINIHYNDLNIVDVFSSIPELGPVLLDHSKPEDPKLGSSYSNTLFGAILSTSVLPRTLMSVYEFFENLEQEAQVKKSVWTGIEAVSSCMHKVFYNLLTNSSETRHKLLNWIGDCLHANASRGKLWNSHSLDPSVMVGMRCVSDGFMINLSSVLLRLCKPFIIPEAVNKLLKVDPTYCAVKIDDLNEAGERGIHMKDMSSETCLISLSADNEDAPSPERPVSTKFNFVTECFYMTHRALDLGMRVLLENLIRTDRDLSILQRVSQNAQNAASQALDVRSLRQRMESELVKHMSMKAALLEPEALELLGDFHVASARWLVQVVMHSSPSEANTYAPLKLIPVSFPLPEVPTTLSCVPEFIIENVACYQTMLERYSPTSIDEWSLSYLEPLLTQVIVFMGSKERMKNPHLRARMAECLETLLPTRQREETQLFTRRTVASANRELLFQSFPHQDQIVVSLLDVFVGIEMTGESVAFEQKFNYRRPMYIAMEYFWKVPALRNSFKMLATEAEQNMEAVQPPLFLRFINLLMNDAVFLLDEALSNMAQLKIFQTARENGEWANLPVREREQNEGYLQHIGMIARFDNILGRSTIETLQYLTSEIKSIFCHPTMVDRIAAMLNYFLVHLVGPKMKNFVVKDRKEYEFKPADLVLNICRIYVNLSESDAFCSAISQDGRSYSPQLFEQAQQVLARIGGGSLIADLMEVASKVAKFATQQETEEELLAEAPEEFLDPIMSSIMMDPVTLPSSKTVVDRSTIARHLLSDQSDPFNRSPLTMDQIVPNDELRERILAWVNERRSQQSSRVSSKLDIKS